MTLPDAVQTCERARADLLELAVALERLGAAIGPLQRDRRRRELAAVLELVAERWNRPRRPLRLDAMAEELLG